MRDRYKLAYVKEYRKAKEVTDAVNDDLEFLDKVDGKFDPFHLAVEEGNIATDPEKPTKRARKDDSDGPSP